MLVLSASVQNYCSRMFWEKVSQLFFDSFMDDRPILAMLMTTNIEVAEQFGRLIAKADYAAAHALRTKEAQKIHSPEDLKAAVKGMTTYAPSPIQQVEVMSDFILEEWPDKQDGDVAIAYVALTGDGFCEAVTVTLAQEGHDIRIRQLEWGRP